MEIFATIDDIEILWRKLSVDEIPRAQKLIEIISDTLREEAFKVDEDIDNKIKERPSYKNVVKSVVVDIVARTLLTSTENEPMTQFSQSAMGYSVSGTFLVPGGGLFIKNSELKKLGLRKQKYGAMEIYDVKRNNSYFDSEDTKW